MDRLQLKDAIGAIAEQCDPSKEQRAVKAVLLCLMGAMSSNRELALLLHVYEFSEGEVAAIQAMKAREKANLN